MCYGWALIVVVIGMVNDHSLSVMRVLSWSEVLLQLQMHCTDAQCTDSTECS